MAVVHEEAPETRAFMGIDAVKAANVKAANLKAANVKAAHMLQPTREVFGRLNDSFTILE